MARPRKATDEQIYEAAYFVMQRLGPADWTLADVAAEAGLTPGALVQRFGSKRALLVALMARFADAGPAMYAALAAQHQSPLAALRAYAQQTSCLAASPEELAHHLDYLRLDLTDPAMRGHFLRHAKAGRSFITSMLKQAVARGELAGTTNVTKLARLVETTVGGSLFTWATYREGRAADWMCRILDDLLEPYLAPGPRRKTR